MSDPRQLSTDAAAGFSIPYVPVNEHRFAATALRGLAANLTAAASSCSDRRSGRIVFLYGSAGVGKSSLLAAYLQQLGESNFPLPVVLITATDLLRLPSRQTDSHHPAVARLLNGETRVLLTCEDVQRFKGHSSAQRRLTRLTDTVINADGAVVFTCRRLPGEIPAVCGRLVSRWRGGVTARVDPPDVSGRRALVRRFFQTRDIHVTEEAVKLLSESATGTLYNLVNRLMKLDTALRHMHSGSLSGKIVRSHFTTLQTDAPPLTISLSKLTASVAREFKVSPAVLRGRSRRAGTVRARRFAMYFARHLAGYSFSQIGRYFGGRNHTTVSYACRQLQQEVLNSASSRSLLEQIRQKLLRMKRESQWNEL